MSCLLTLTNILREIKSWSSKYVTRLLTDTAELDLVSSDIHVFMGLMSYAGPVSRLSRPGPSRAIAARFSGVLTRADQFK